MIDASGSHERLSQGADLTILRMESLAIALELVFVLIEDVLHGTGW